MTPGAILVDEYNAAHRVCPKCGSDHLAVTYIGYIPRRDAPGAPAYYESGHKDENSAKCQCGWHGITHDLKPTLQTLVERYLVAVDNLMGNIVLTTPQADTAFEVTQTIKHQIETALSRGK